jgi:3-isopropylmalate/(R)-2-methylmalate dehydratase small subunit
MKTFGGKVLFLDRANINTDEIIPAKYLTENDKSLLKPHILEDLKLPGLSPAFEPLRDCAGKSVIVTRENFGCGSSREHAPWVLELNGINMVIAPAADKAPAFARIFRQNMFNCGMIACELPAADVDGLFADFAGKDTEAAADLAAGSLAFRAGGLERRCSFSLGEFEKALVEAGGWVNYAEKHY